jgi:hypothetical protein
VRREDPFAMSRVDDMTRAKSMAGAKTETESPELQTFGDELQEAGSGRSPATPAWLLLAVVAVVAALVVVALTIVALAYLLS